MPETPTGTTELASQYSTRVADDLNRNLEQQERLSGEIEELQAQLTALRHDNTVLVSIQQAIGVSSSSAVEPQATVPAARAKHSTSKAADGRKLAEKSPTAARKRTGLKSAAATPASPSKTPKLVDLVRDHLTGCSEPLSAAEVTTALGQQHPERTIKATVIRTTLEGLVAKNQARRNKQGSSVFYTAPETGEQEESAAQPSSNNG